LIATNARMNVKRVDASSRILSESPIIDRGWRYEESHGKVRTIVMWSSGMRQQAVL
jgi:hypothetical protein